MGAVRVSDPRRTAARVVAVGALLGLLGWLLLGPRLLDFYDTGTPSKPAAALAMLLLAVALSGDQRRRRGRLCGAAAGLVAAETLLAYALGHPSLTADLLFPEAWEAGTTDGGGQMNVGSALALLALAASVLLTARPRAAAALAALSFALPYAALVGHLYGAEALVAWRATTGMAPPTAVGVLVLALVQVLDPRLRLHPLLVSRAIAGSLVRRLLPWCVLAPPLAGLLVLRGLREGWYGPGYAVALLALAFTTTTLAATFVGARTAAQVDRGRERVLDELEALNAVLSERVAVAVAEAEEQQVRLELLLERTPVGIFETGPDGVRRFTNARWRSLAGVRDGQDAGAHWTEALHPEDRERVASRWVECIAAGREYADRYRYLHADGTVTWVDVAAVAVRGSSGEVTRWLGSVNDVTAAVTAADQLAASESRYRSVVTAMSEGVVLQDAAGAILTANEAACRLLGLTEEQLTGRVAADERWQAVDPDGAPLSSEDFPAMAALHTATAVHDVVMGVRRGDGDLVWLSVNAEPLLDPTSESPVATGVVTTFVDVTAARGAADALRRSEEQFRAAMAHAPIGMAIVELDGTFREVNLALCRLVGHEEHELEGQTFSLLTHPDDRAALHDVAALLAGEVDHATVEQRILTRSGEVVWVLLAVSCAYDADGAPASFVAQFQDVTAARAEARDLEHRALHDTLTGLPNRDLLMDRLAHSLARSSRSGALTAVLFCDLDDFKDVNDTHGHEAGDRVLVEVAERLRSVLRPGDTVARLGGDEFVVLAEQMPDLAAVDVLAERVRGCLLEPVDLDGVLLATTGSVGVAVAGSDDDARSLLRSADAAMYRAKARGRARVETASTLPGARTPART